MCSVFMWLQDVSVVVLKIDSDIQHMLLGTLLNIIRTTWLERKVHSFKAAKNEIPNRQRSEL